MANYCSNIDDSFFQSWLVPDPAGFCLYQGNPLDESKVARDKTFAIQVFKSTRAYPFTCVQVYSCAYKSVCRFCDSAVVSRWYSTKKTLKEILDNEILIELKLREIVPLLRFE